MSRARNFRVIFLLAILTVIALTLLLREQPPSFVRSGLHLDAYVSAADGSVTVIDLVKLQAVNRIPVGPTISGVREPPHRPEIWGLSSTGGYAWVLNARSQQITARIPVGALPFALDFSPDGTRMY